MRRRRPFGFKGQLEMADDPVDGLSYFDKRDDSHLATTCGATQGIHFIDLADHLCPTFGREMLCACGKRAWILIFDLIKLLSNKKPAS